MSTFKVQIMSDLHLETPASRPIYDQFDVEPGCSCLALLGDIGNVLDPRLFSFLGRQLEAFETVLFLLGNHEPYGSTLERTRSSMRAFESHVQQRRRSTESSVGKFVFLDKTRFDYSDKVTVLGCTLFSAIVQTEETSVARFVTDFSNIEDWDVQRHNAEHRLDLQWLDQQVSALTANEPDRSIIILTHHSPTKLKQANDPHHMENASRVQSAFVTDLSKHICWTAPTVKIWAFGHTHFNCDFIDPATGKRVFANQKGYTRAENPSFDLLKIITPDAEAAQSSKESRSSRRERIRQVALDKCLMS